ncbi:MAG: NifU family protein [Deltaproteobacteria bacterium]|nr:NifU family protein [Deltaproteobacteria bacterium]
MSHNTVILDLRGIPVFERHPRIFDTWEELQAEETLRIINDHDPKPLHYQFEGEYKDSYGWEYVKKGPEEWVVNIKKLKKAEASGTELRKKVEEALNEVRPYLQADGGDVQLVDIDDVSKVVTVRLAGACGGCPSASMTLKSGVERTIQKHAPEIKSVVSVQ